MAWIFDGSRPVVIAGAARMGRAFLRELRRLGVEPMAFADNDRAKWGSTIDGLTVIAPDATPKDAVILVGSLLAEREIYGQFAISLGLPNVYPLSYLHRHRPDVFQMVHMDGLWMEEGDVLRVGLGSWDDRRSLEIMRGIMGYRHTQDVYAYARLMTRETQYFPPDLLTLTHGDVIVDAGAFTGDTLATMRAFYPDIAPAYFAFEPDPVNFRKLTQSAADYPGTVVAVQAGLGEAEGDLQFDASGGGDAHVSPSGATTIPVHTIDRFFAGRTPPTFIKMDIEGMEPEALRGAAETIRAHRPKLAIAVYHAPDHLWSIPLYVRSLRPDYRLYLRHYTTNLTDSVMYAV